jgi:transcriptional regulator with XRE-family HTH domain
MGTQIQTPSDRMLRERRLAAGLTQRQLAIAAGCSLPSVANIEAGVMPRRSEVVPRLLAALDAAEREAAP